MKTGKCDYCDTKDVELRGTPYMVDIPARMCEECWNYSRGRGLVVEGIDIGEFKTEIDC